MDNMINDVYFSDEFLVDFKNRKFVKAFLKT